MEKKLILLTGSSTVGKTTFLKFLFKIYRDKNFFPLIQATSRDKRKDDDLRFIRHYPEEEFKKLNFWIHHKQYGVTRDDITAFLASKKQFAIGIVGVYELIQAKETILPNLEVKSVLIKMSTDFNLEESLVINNIKSFFKNPELRIEQNRRHLFTFFLNREFMEKYIDLTLTREKGIFEWVREIEREFKIPQIKKISKKKSKILLSDLMNVRIKS